MVDNENTLHYSDFIQPDDSIVKLIGLLDGLDDKYAKLAASLKKYASTIKEGMADASVATQRGADAIEEASIAADRLFKAQRELAMAQSEVGKNTAILKAQLSELNRNTVEQDRLNKAAEGSYKRLRLELKDNVELYKALSEAERNDAAMGGALLDIIKSLKEQIKALDTAMKPTVETVSRLEKARRRLAEAMSSENAAVQALNDQTRKKNSADMLSAQINDTAEGSYERLRLELRQITAQYEALSAAERNDVAVGGVLLRRIGEIKVEMESYNASVNESIEMSRKLERARRGLAAATSAENKNLISLRLQTSKANRIARLQAQIANSAHGSYNNLAAQYELNKIRILEMSEAERRHNETLIQTQASIRAQMVAIQESTGTYSLSVGRYNEIFNNLSYSVQQIVRELPAAAVSLNTFFLAISNNIPILIDEIKKLKMQGRSSGNVIASIVKSLFSWQSAIIIVLAAFSKWGKEIVGWGKSVLYIRDSVESFRKTMSRLKKEMREGRGSYAEQLVSYKKLQSEYSRLSSDMEKTDFIRDNTQAFKELGVVLTDVSEADAFFVRNSDEVVTALMLRAKAAAATKLAEQAFAEVLSKRIKLEEELLKEKNLYNSEGYARILELRAKPPETLTASENQELGIYSLGEARVKKSVKLAQDNLKVAEANADNLLGIVDGFLKNADEIFENTGFRSYVDGISEYTKKIKDYQEEFNRSVVEYDNSTTELIQETSEKRIKAAKDEAAKRIMSLELMTKRGRELEEEYNRVLTNDGIYKAKGKSYRLSGEQLSEIRGAIDNIISSRGLIDTTIVNIREQLKHELDIIDRDSKIRELERANEIFGLRLEAVQKYSNEELDIRLNVIENERRIALIENSKLAEEERKDESYINEAFRNKELSEKAQFRQEEFKRAQSVAKAEFDLVARYAEEAKDFELRQKLDAERFKLDLINEGLIKASDAEKRIIEYTIASIEREITANKDSITLFDAQREVENIKAATEDINWELDNYYANEKMRSRRELEAKLREYNSAIERLNKQKDLYSRGLLVLSPTDIASIDAEIDRLNASINLTNKEMSELDSILNDIADKGLVGGLLNQLGFNDDQIDAFTSACNTIIGYLGDIAQSEVELAQKSVEAAEQRVSAAQSAVDAEIEARNNGYAHSLEQAKKDLALEQANQKKKQRLLEEAQKRQSAIDTVTQSSSLITASANIWSVFSKAGVFGPALAITAIASMWASFIAAKAKAREVSRQEYGEGGLEFLSGGSHASGHDINLGVTNSRGHKMYAEGGEALAIINRANTRKYRSVLPEVIDSLNKGDFEKRYLQSLRVSPDMFTLQQNVNTDLSGIERAVSGLLEQGRKSRYITPDGREVIINGNIKTVVRYE